MFGHTLKLIRLCNDMSVNAVALQMQIGFRRLNKIENGKTKISLSTLIRFSELYQMPISQILILNDMKEHFKISDSEMWEDIERFYVTKQDEPEEPMKSKKRGA